MAIRTLTAVAVAWTSLTVTASMVAAAPITVDFSTLAKPDGAAFTSVTQEGVTVTSQVGPWQHALLLGNPDPSIFTFGIVPGTFPQLRVTMGGSPFRFIGLDLGTDTDGAPGRTTESGAGCKVWSSSSSLEQTRTRPSKRS